MKYHPCPVNGITFLFQSRVAIKRASNPYHKPTPGLQVRLFLPILPSMRSSNLHLLLVCLSLLVSATTAPAQRPDTRDREQISDDYKWDFSRIYDDWDSWQRGMETFADLIPEYESLQGTLAEDPAQVLQAFQLGDRMGILAYKIFRYPQLQRDVDQKNNDLQARFQEVQALFARWTQATAWFDPELLTIPEEKMEQWIEENQELETYAFPIRNLYRQQAHVLDEKSENLLALFTQFNRTPRSTFEALSISDIVYPEIEFSDGETETITYGQYIRTLQTNRNQADRQAAFEVFYDTYIANKNTYAAIYNGILQRGWAFAQARNYTSTLAATLDTNNIPVAVVENLVETVKAGTGPVQRYHALRKKYLGLDEYHLYDTSIPLIEDDTEYYYDDVVSLIEESVTVFGDEYVARMGNMFSGGFVDVYENEGKRSGAYMATVYGVAPYVLLNYNDTLDAVFTLAHEMGHALHTKLSMESQPFATSNYTIFVAEVAAILNEKLLLREFLRKTDDPRARAALLEKQIQDILGTFFTQVMFANYELEAHKAAEAGQPITADSLSEIYWDLLMAYYGDAVTHAEPYRYTWTRIPHFFHSPFYVYQYATCYASSAELFKQMTTGPEESRQAAIERYLTLLRSGGNDYPMEQLKKAGVDLSTPAPIQAVVDELDRLVSQLEEELQKLDEFASR